MGKKKTPRGAVTAFAGAGVADAKPPKPAGQYVRVNGPFSEGFRV